MKLVCRARTSTHHLVNKRRCQVAEKCPNGDAELFADIACATTEDSAQDVTTSDVARHTAVADCESERSDVVCHDSVGGVDAVRVFLAELPGIRPGAGQFLNAGKEWQEHVRVIVRPFILQH